MPTGLSHRSQKLSVDSSGVPSGDHGRVERILVVDDERGVRDSLSAFLERHGFKAEAAADAFRARELLQAEHFDLVLTDISMPEVSGIALLDEINALYERVLVIMITGYLDVSFAVDAMRRGAYDYFTKPLNFEKILLTIERITEHRRMVDRAQRYEVLRAQKEFEDQAVIETTLGLARAVEERDRYNIGHGKRTANYALLLGKALDFTDEHLRLLRHAALVHDIGKIGIDDRILNKPDRLTEAEFEAIRRHSEIGEYILKPISFLRDMSAVIRHHHERWDGRGYPDGCSKEEIPLDARIVCIADFFDSITSARPYRHPMSLDEAFALIQKERGGHFDPLLADLFIEAATRGA